MRVLVTGATGFIGPSVVAELARRGHEVIAGVRRDAQVDGAAAVRVCADLSMPLDELVAGVDAVVHLAGVAHRHGVGEGEHDRVNHRGTLSLARAAFDAGARRFVFMSSSKVHGESTDVPLSSSAPLAPENSYARSKADAERALRSLCSEEQARTVVSLRPPVVYGVEAKANIGALGALVERGVPIPRLVPEPRRSVISRPHVADAVGVALDLPCSGYHGFVLADERPITLSELAEAVAGRPVRSLPVPALVARTAASFPLLARFRAITQTFEIDNAEWEAATGGAAWPIQLELLGPTASSAATESSSQRGDGAVRRPLGGQADPL